VTFYISALEILLLTYLLTGGRTEEGKVKKGGGRRRRKRREKVIMVLLFPHFKPYRQGRGKKLRFLPWHQCEEADILRDISSVRRCSLRTPNHRSETLHRQ